MPGNKLVRRLVAAHAAVILATLAFLSAYHHGALRSLAFALLFPLGLAVVLTLRIVGPLRDRLQDVSAFTRRTGDGLFRPRLIVQKDTLLSDLEANLNDAADRLETRLTSLADEKTKLETAFLGISDGVLLLNAEGRVTLANEAIRELFGFAGDLRGRPVLEVLRNNALAEIVSRAQERHEQASAEIDILFPRPRALTARAIPIVQNTAGRDLFLGTAVALHDVTRLKTLEQTRRDFVANVSHELKTPLAAIKGFAETLRDGAIDDRESALSFLAIIESHASRLNRLVEDLLVLSRIELGEIAVAMQPAKLGRLAEDAALLMRNQAAMKKITVTCDVQQDLPAVQADPDRITQVMLNLLDNAVKFSKEGGTVRVRAHSVEGGAVEVSIRDSGPGIAPHHLPRLGERFYRVDPARSRELGGTGLGLAIVKHLLQAHGTSLTVANAAGGGAVVSFRLPLVP